MFEKRLDHYESALATRSGAIAAHDARKEMAAHLEAGYAARLEYGATEAEARIGTLKAIGDLDGAARNEPASPIRWMAEAGVLGASLLLWASWSASVLSAGAPRLIVTLLSALLLVAALALGLRGGRERSPFVLWALATMPALLVFALYAVGMRSSMATACGLSAMLVASVLALIAGATRRRTAWDLGFFLGLTVFIAQTAGVEFSVRQYGARPSYPLDVTLGTLLVFTLPLLLLSALGAGIAGLSDRLRRTRAVAA